MKTKRSPDSITTVGLTVALVLTAVHAWHRYSGGTPDAIEVSHFEPKTAFPPNLTVARFDSVENGYQGLLEPVRCQVIIVFYPGCPACRRAAMQEAEIPDREMLPTAWVMSHEDSLAIGDFASVLREDSPVYISQNANELLHINAVPAAFVVDSLSIVREVTVYLGNRQQMERFRRSCGLS